MIKMTDVRFRWSSGEKWDLHIPDFSVDEGERVFLEGPSGSGKTTLLNLLGGVVSPEHGCIKIDGTNLESLAPAKRDAFRADNIGFIFQMFNLIPYLSLIDNVALPCRFSLSREKAALEKSGAIEKEAARLLAHMEIDANDLSDRNSYALSTGQQQRIAVARSLIGAPKLIIADEPTSALDQNLRMSFLDMLFREVGETGATLLFVSHDTTLAENFDRRVTLADINRTGPA